MNSVPQVDCLRVFLLISDKDDSSAARGGTIPTAIRDEEKSDRRAGAWYDTHSILGRHRPNDSLYLFTVFEFLDGTATGRINSTRSISSNN